ncbi:MAG TPA: hypothetical protein V6D27_17680 [Vampirovibrionales bacterium]
MRSELEIRWGLWERRRSPGCDQVQTDNGIKMCDRLRTSGGLSWDILSFKTQ